MKNLSMFLFGQFQAVSDGQEISGLEAHRTQELWAYLLLYRERRHLREALAGVLWGESSSAQSKKNLRQTLWQLQNALERGREGRHPGLILVDAESVSLPGSAALWVDVAEFEAVYDQVQGVDGASLSVEQSQRILAAVPLYRGDLLEGWYHDWCLCERERYQNMYLTLLDKLGSYCEAHGEYENGLAHGTRVLRVDPASERTHRRMMRLYYRSGDRTGAIRQFERCVAALQEELGVQPSRRTMALYEQICSDQAGVDAAMSVPTPALSVALVDPGRLRPAEEEALAEVVMHLRGLKNSLADVRQQLSRDIQLIEQFRKYSVIANQNHAPVALGGEQSAAARTKPRRTVPATSG